MKDESERNMFERREEHSPLVLLLHILHILRIHSTRVYLSMSRSVLSYHLVVPVEYVPVGPAVVFVPNDVVVSPVFVFSPPPPSMFGFSRLTRFFSLFSAFLAFFSRFNLFLSASSSSFVSCFGCCAAAAVAAEAAKFNACCFACNSACLFCRMTKATTPFSFSESSNASYFCFPKSNAFCQISRSNLPNFGFHG